MDRRSQFLLLIFAVALCSLVAGFVDAQSAIAQDAFITTWQTTTPNEAITIPTNGGFNVTDYGFEIDWSDGTVEAVLGDDPDPTHTYASTGIHTVAITGTFPNPAHARATVRYAAPKQTDVTIRVYDVLGRMVHTLAEGPAQGRTEMQFDVSRLPSGLYFLQLQAGAEIKTQRLTVVK